MTSVNGEGIQYVYEPLPLNAVAYPVLPPQESRPAANPYPTYQPLSEAELRADIRVLKVISNEVVGEVFDEHETEEGFIRAHSREKPKELKDWVWLTIASLAVTIFAILLVAHFGTLGYTLLLVGTVLLLTATAGKTISLALSKRENAVADLYYTLVRDQNRADFDAFIRSHKVTHEVSLAELKQWHLLFLRQEKINKVLEIINNPEIACKYAQHVRYCIGSNYAFAGIDPDAHMGQISTFQREGRYDKDESALIYDARAVMRMKECMKYYQAKIEKDAELITNKPV